MRLYENTKEVLVIIPAYNEEHAIEKVLDELEQPPLSELADVLVINDASVDRTADLVRGRGHHYVTHIFNLGYGSALQVGYKYAVRRGYRYVIQMDADGQHDPCNILPIYERLTQPDAPDIVLGSRYMAGSGKYPLGWAKKAAYAIFRMMIRLFTGRRIADPTTGLQGLSWRALVHYAQYNRFDFTYPDANMIMQMLLLGFRVEEIPAVMHVRESGKSMHSGLKPIGYMIQMTLSILGVVFRIRVLKEGGVSDAAMDASPEQRNEPVERY